ncbi:MAG: DNA helicase [Oscillatoriales cyanobacterium]|nr:MAG: DNA helicase [Oscillatoriales cyanobacterium]
MPNLNLKPTHQPVKAYYNALGQFAKLGISHELAVKDAFADLLKSCCQQFGWTLVPEKEMKIGNNKRIRVDGELVRADSLRHGIWEAKDTHDKLEREVKQKFAVGYPKDNIIFQAPERAIIWQGGKQLCDEDITKPQSLVDTLKLFFEYRTPAIAQWEVAAAEFGSRVKDLAGKLISLIDGQRKTNKRFIQAFNDFTAVCRQSINPNLSEAAVEEMLIQHILTERIFRRIFDNPDFTNRNIIAVEIEKVINALTSKSFSRDHFLGEVDYFYRALEATAATIDEFSEKQHFLNTIYEKFFQGFAIKVADTHGIVYTPQPIVNFMVKSVEDILQKEFGKSLSDKGVHILDPFVGTGNFMMRVMREIRKTALPQKYADELHCNELMLLPYYIASMNIEHEYFEATGTYQPFEGICLVDTFSDQKVQQLSLFTAANTARVERQRSSPIFVVVGNPPYNAFQISENDNNKNRKYEEIDRRVAETYSKDSKATNKNALSDPYVKAIRWASDRIGDEGIVALVTNNSFVNDIAFDGMRKNLAKDFNSIYVLDLKGNVRKDSMREGIAIGEKHTIFGLGAMVGISVTFLVKRKQTEGCKIFYNEVDWKATRKEKFELLEKAGTIENLEWQEITPDKKNNWLTEGLQDDFEKLIPIGGKEAKASKKIDERVIFNVYSRGAETARDTWAYNFKKDDLGENIRLFIDNYNHQVYRWHHLRKPGDTIDNFVEYEDTKIKWSSRLKECLAANVKTEFNPEKIRLALYRPFSLQFLYFDEVLTHRRGQFPYIFPVPDTEKENRVIAVTNHSQIPFLVQMTDCISDVGVGGRPGQCFPFYIYDEDGTNRRENITDWALTEFRRHYGDDRISKWDIFYYVYAVLHHPTYCTRYAANLKRELPHIPYTPDFHSFANAGKRLAEIHVNYEQQPEYPLKWIENTDVPLDWRVEKMRLSKDKTQLIYNDFLTLSGIPSSAFEYRLGNRSALDWVIDQYQFKTDKRSGIVNDPNRLDDEQYIVRLIGQVIAVCLETVQIVGSLPSVGIGEEDIIDS